MSVLFSMLFPGKIIPEEHSQNACFSYFTQTVSFAFFLLKDVTVTVVFPFFNAFTLPDADALATSLLLLLYVILPVAGRIPWQFHLNLEYSALLRYRGSPGLLLVNLQLLSDAFSGKTDACRVIFSFTPSVSLF